MPSFRIPEKVRHWARRKSAQILAKCVVHELVKDGHPPETAARIVDREIKAISEDYRSTFAWEKSEQRILEDRLNRRYDLGSALNEAANRALAGKAKDNPLNWQTPSMSGSQAAALEYQKKYLENIVKNGGGRH